MIRYIDLSLKILCYFGYFAGLFLFVAPLIAPFIRNRIYISKLRNEYNRPSNKRKSRLYSHIQILIYTVYGTRSFNAVFFFFMISVGLFVMTVMLLTMQRSFSIFTIILSLTAGMLPYLFLQLKLRSIRIQGSYEAEGLITELINQYKINFFNMIEAIDKTIPFLNDYPYSKRSLFRLSIKVKDYTSATELDQAISEFVYSVNTEWATMLGMNIYIAIIEGANVIESLDDILQELKSLRSVVEKDKRENNESFFMIKYLIIFLLAFSVFCEVIIFNISIDDIIRFQFSTPLGIKLSVAIAILAVLNYGLLYLFRKPKYDF